jgi:hypothetical protein
MRFLPCPLKTRTFIDEFGGRDRDRTGDFLSRCLGAKRESSGIWRVTAKDGLAFIQHVFPLMHPVYAVFLDHRAQTGDVVGILRGPFATSTAANPRLHFEHVTAQVCQGPRFGRNEEVFQLLDGEALVERDGADGHVILAGGSEEILRRRGRGARSTRPGPRPQTFLVAPHRKSVSLHKKKGIYEGRL